MNNVIKDIFAILSPAERKKMYWLTACNLLISLLDIFSLAAILFIIHFYTQPANPLPFLPPWLMDAHSATLVILFLIFFLVKNTAAHIVLSAQYRFVYSVASRLSQANMLSYLQGNYTAHVHTDSAVNIRAISQQPVEFAQYILQGTQQIIMEAALILLSVTALLIYNAAVFVMVLLLLLPAALLLWLYARRKITTARGEIKSRSEAALQHLKESLAGYVESNIYGKNMFFTQRYAKSQRSLNNAIASLQALQGMPSRLLEVFAVLGLLVLILAANIAGGNTAQSFITLGAFMAAAYKIIPGLVKIINLSGQIKAYRFVITALKNEAAGTAAIKATDACPALHSIQFRDVSFSYGSNTVIKHLSFHAERKDFIGINAPSGKGKTTLLNILLGLIHENCGEVMINGKPRDAEERKKFWPRIAYVKQQTFLLHDSIEKNIALDDEIINNEKLSGIIHAAGLDCFIAGFAEGAQKIITENGKNISGGQRQRIAFARALYKGADMLILDEPFSELDNNSEELLLAHCQKLAADGKIVILITHQQKSLAFCNKIVSLHG